MDGAPTSRACLAYDLSGEAALLGTVPRLV